MELNMAGLVWKMYQPFVEAWKLVETTENYAFPHHKT